jgi:hypothetical protein
VHHHAPSIHWVGIFTAFGVLATFAQVYRYRHDRMRGQVDQVSAWLDLPRRLKSGWAITVHVKNSSSVALTVHNLVISSYGGQDRQVVQPRAIAPDQSWSSEIIVPYRATVLSGQEHDIIPLPKTYFITVTDNAGYTWRRYLTPTRKWRKSPPRWLVRIVLWRPLLRILMRVKLYEQLWPGPPDLPWAW